MNLGLLRVVGFSEHTCCPAFHDLNKPPGSNIKGDKYPDIAYRPADERDREGQPQEPVLHPGQDKTDRPEEGRGLGHPQVKGLAEGLVGELISGLVGRSIPDLEGLDGQVLIFFGLVGQIAGNNGAPRPKPRRR